MTETGTGHKAESTYAPALTKQVRQLLLSFNNENSNKTKQVNNSIRYLSGSRENYKDGKSL